MNFALIIDLPDALDPSARALANAELQIAGFARVRGPKCLWLATKKFTDLKTARLAAEGACRAAGVIIEKGSLLRFDDFLEFP